MARKSSRLPMTLRRRFLLQNLLLVGGLVLAGGLSIWRLEALRARVSLPHNVFAEFRTLGNVGVEIGNARGLLSNPRPDSAGIVTHLGYAIGGLEQFIHVGEGYGPGNDTAMQQAYAPINRQAARGLVNLRAALSLMKSARAGATEEARKSVDAAAADLDHISTSCMGFVSGQQQQASSELATNLLLIGSLSLAAALAAIVLSVAQDRLVMVPLQRLRSGVRRAAEAEFSQPLDPAEMASAPEFIDLAREFNRMASELDGFYRRLEEQVRAKSRELIQSERLTSVGFLAAGVAHEINNPLNVMSGHAELVARQLAPGRAPLSAEEIAQAQESLRIIQDEAFRCKEITEKLLSLARTGSQGREWLDLCDVARDVAAMTKGLKSYRTRRLKLNLGADRLEVEANPTEMKQVLLNLTINALESAPQVDGEVCIEGRQMEDWVEFCVKDNGKGMTPDVLPHVFEPFFTARRGSGNRGTGLGLSITHAIVKTHGGRLLAESEGLGRGARFTVRLPGRRTISGSTEGGN